MKRLIIGRHGHAENGLDTTDKDRALSTIGLNTIPAMGQLLAKQQWHIDHIICSPALRTLTTATLLSQALKIPAEQIEQSATIYQADVDNLLTVIHQLAAGFSTVLLIGHNPSISNLVNYLLPQSVSYLVPGSLVAIEFPVAQDWHDIQKQIGKLAFFITPADL